MRAYRPRPWPEPPRDPGGQNGPHGIRVSLKLLTARGDGTWKPRPPELPQPASTDALSCRHDARQDHRPSGRRPRYEEPDLAFRPRGRAPRTLAGSTRQALCPSRCVIGSQWQPARVPAVMHACALGRWCSQTHAERVFGAFMAEASCVRHNWRPASPAEAAVSRRGCSGSVTTPAGSNWRSLTRSSLTAGDPECRERVRGRPMAVRDARRWYGRHRANRPEPAVGSAPRSLVRERADRGPGGLLVPTGVGEPG